MVFNATFNNISVISWRSVLLVEETEGPAENHRPVTSHWQTLSYIMLYTSPWSRFELTTSVVIGTDCIGSCKSNYHTITATTSHVNVVVVNMTLIWLVASWNSHYILYWAAHIYRVDVSSKVHKFIVMKIHKIQAIPRRDKNKPLTCFLSMTKPRKKPKKTNFLRK